MGRMQPASERQWSNTTGAWTEIHVRMPAEGGVLWGVTLSIASTTATASLSGRILVVYDWTSTPPAENAVSGVIPIFSAALGTTLPMQVLVPWSPLNWNDGLSFHGPRKLPPSSATFLIVDVRNDTGAAVGTRLSLDMELVA